jgi:protein-L-isoaspartate(D-aspartate) O-methyltransferase
MQRSHAVGGPRAPLLPDSARARMVEELRGLGIKDAKVLKAMAKIPRHEFVSEAMRFRAYENSALPIGEAQTISQPYVVALMTEALFGGRPVRRVLEVGTGSGYQTAVLTEVVGSVFSMERLRGLSVSARERLSRLGYHNIVFNYGDGMQGWPGHAPYDGILVTAGTDALPPQLVAQLAPGGRLILPLGPTGRQDLIAMEKQADGRMTQRVLAPASFVPLLAGKA